MSAPALKRGLRAAVNAVGVMAADLRRHFGGSCFEDSAHLLEDAPTQIVALQQMAEVQHRRSSSQGLTRLHLGPETLPTWRSCRTGSTRLRAKRLLPSAGSSG